METVGQDDYNPPYPIAPSRRSQITFDQEYLETVGQEDSNPPDPPAPPRRSQGTFDQEDLEAVGQEDSAPPDLPAPPRRNQQKSDPPSCYFGTRAQEQEKAKNVAVRRSKKGYQ